MIARTSTRMIGKIRKLWHNERLAEAIRVHNSCRVARMELIRKNKGGEAC